MRRRREEDEEEEKRRLAHKKNCNTLSYLFRIFEKQRAGRLARSPVDRFWRATLGMDRKHVHYALMFLERVCAHTFDEPTFTQIARRTVRFLF